MNAPEPKLSTFLARGWRRKCPHCGEGNLYRKWMRLHEHCPVCGVKYLENQGDLIGPLMFLDRVLFIVPVIVLFYFGVWHPTLPGVVVFGGAASFLFVYTLPHRNGVSVALDYYIRLKEGRLEKETPPASSQRAQ